MACLLRRTQSEASKKENDHTSKINGFNSNTIKDTVVGGTALPLSTGSSLALPKETLTPVSLPTSSTLYKPAPIPGNVPSAFVSALYNRGFVDGRFIFRAWGKIQLAFKAFGITYPSIAATDEEHLFRVCSSDPGHCIFYLTSFRIMSISLS